MNTAERDAEYIQARAEAIGGMSLRDYFAAKAMPTFLRPGESNYKHAAEYAYLMADAMLEARK